MENIPVLDYSYKYSDAKPGYSYSFIAPSVLSMLKGGKLRVLELGCGNGYFSNDLANEGHEVMAVDSSESAIEIAKSNFSHVRFIRSDLYDLVKNPALPKNYFDVVVSLEVIEHLQYPKEMLKVTKKHLKQGGRFIISTPYHGYFKNLALSLVNGWDRHFSVMWDVGHVKFFSPVTLKHMLNGEGFVNVTFKFVGRFPGFWKSMICVCELP